MGHHAAGRGMMLHTAKTQPATSFAVSARLIRSDVKLTVPTSVVGPSRHFAATPDVGRSRTETDINRQARPAASVAN